MELLQDFHFPAACQRLRPSRDGRYLFATGTHAPRVRVYDLSQLSMKFERHFNAQVADFAVLSDDYSKAAFACEDRGVYVHAKGGEHAVMRVPAAPRAVEYCRRDATLLVAGSAPSVWRIDLAEGRFRAPLELSRRATQGGPDEDLADVGIDGLAVSETHGLIAACRDDGVVTCYDPRERAPVGALDVVRSVGGAFASNGALRSLGAGGASKSLVAATVAQASPGVRSVAFDSRGLRLGAGLSDGRVAVFDLRSSKPVMVRDHGYDAPVVRLQFLDGTGSAAGGGVGADDDPAAAFAQAAAKTQSAWAAPAGLAGSGGMGSLYGSGAPSAPSSLGTSLLASADRRGVRVWDVSAGADAPPALALESPADVNDMLVWPGSGLVLTACDAAACGAYFAPSLGPAPAWCSFLEAMTEEMEESAAPAAYENYRFVPRDDVERLGLSHLVGTPLLRPSMHGFFVHARLHERARLAAGLSAAAADAGGSMDAASLEAELARKRAQARLEAERQSRIGAVRVKPKVNAAFAARAAEAEAKLRAEQGSSEAEAEAEVASEDEAGGASRPFGVDESSDEDEDRGAKRATGAYELEPATKSAKRRKATAAAEAALPAVLRDPRFAALFEDERFAIDEGSDEYLARHPGQAASAGGGKLGRGGSHLSSEAALIDEHFRAADDADAGEPAMLASKAPEAAAAFRKGRSIAREREAPLGERVRESSRGGGDAPRKHKVLGSREMNFEVRGGKRERGGDNGRGRGRGGRGRGGGGRGGRGRGGRGRR